MFPLRLLLVLCLTIVGIFKVFLPVPILLDVAFAIAGGYFLVDAVVVAYYLRTIYLAKERRERAPLYHFFFGSTGWRVLQEQVRDADAAVISLYLMAAELGDYKDNIAAVERLLREKGLRAAQNIIAEKVSEQRVRRQHNGGVATDIDEGEYSYKKYGEGVFAKG